jgi:hypothetical protein
MISFLGLLLHVLALPFRSQASLEAEIVFLRHQLNVLKRQVPARPRLTTTDRWLFVRLYRWIPSLLNAAVIVRPNTIVRWVGDLRGTLRNFGLKVGVVGVLKFEARIRELTTSWPPPPARTVRRR